MSTKMLIGSTLTLVALACATPTPKLEPLIIRFEALQLENSAWTYRFADCAISIDAEYEGQSRPEWEGKLDPAACEDIRKAARNVPWSLLEGDHIGTLTPDGFRSSVTVQKADGSPLRVLVENCDAPDLAALEAAINAGIPNVLQVVLTNNTETEPGWSPGSTDCR